MNAATALIDASRGAKVALIQHGGGQRTYAELAERVNRAGNALRALGVGRGERVVPGLSGHHVTVDAVQRRLQRDHVAWFVVDDQDTDGGR